jgi:hypothetical protein
MDLDKYMEDLGIYNEQQKLVMISRFCNKLMIETSKIVEQNKVLDEVLKTVQDENTILKASLKYCLKDNFRMWCLAVFCSIFFAWLGATL